MSNMKFAFHVHTKYSSDSRSEPEDIIRYCRKNNIQAIAITDHNEIEGAFECQKIAQGNPIVIIGEEIKTIEGEIIGLFITSKIKPGQTPEETINQIRSQGGAVCLPHPGETFRRESLPRSTVEAIMNKIDIIESGNSRTLLNSDMKWAQSIAKKNIKPTLVGSDAHFINKINCAINNIAEFSNPVAFLKSLEKGNSIEFKQSGIYDQILSKIVKLKKRYSISK